MKEIKCRDLLANEIECRVGTVKEGKGFSLLLYKTARADMQLLDEVYGVNNWQCRYYQVKNTMICAISIWDEEKKCWIEKCDGGDDDFNAEKVKGECSDAFKRAGFRVLPSTRKLYNSPFIWINEDSNNNKFTKYEVAEIGYDETSVTRLVIINEKTKQVAYSYGVGAKSGYNKPKSAEKGNVTLNEVSSSVSSMEEMIPQDTFEEDLRVVSAYKNEKYKTEDGKNNFNAYLTRVFGKTNLADFTTEELHKLALAVKKAQGR